MFSIVIPSESNRLNLLGQTMLRYQDMAEWITEMIIVSRTINQDDLPSVSYPVKFIKYEYEGEWVNPVRARNLGVAAATCERVVVTCPEVYPYTNVLKQFAADGAAAVVAKVYEQDQSGQRFQTLVSSQFRGEHPGMCFLACYNRSKLIELNGWDEEFLKGVGYDDNDFGERWVTAKYAYSMNDDIVADHLYHPRDDQDRSGSEQVNREQYIKNRAEKVTKVRKGIK